MQRTPQARFTSFLEKAAPNLGITLCSRQAPLHFERQSLVLVCSLSADAPCLSWKEQRVVKISVVILHAVPAKRGRITLVLLSLPSTQA